MILLQPPDYPQKCHGLTADVLHCIQVFGDEARLPSIMVPNKVIVT